MALRICNTDLLNWGEQAQLVSTMSPQTLVPIGPNLQAALDSLVSTLISQAHALSFKPRHLATTYSLRTLVLIFECSETADSTRSLLYRLRFSDDQLAIRSFSNPVLSQRITRQLRTIHQRQPGLIKPFQCSEDWSGIGPAEHPILDRMVKASASVESWRNFKASVSTPPYCSCSYVADRHAPFSVSGSSGITQKTRARIKYHRGEQHGKAPVNASQHCCSTEVGR